MNVGGLTLIIVVSVVYAVIIAVEVPNMVRKKLWRELIVYSFIMLLAIIYSFGLLLNWQLPNLLDGLEILFTPVTQYFEKLLT